MLWSDGDTATYIVHLLPCNNNNITLKMPVIAAETCCENIMNKIRHEH